MIFENILVREFKNNTKEIGFLENTEKQKSSENLFVRPEHPSGTQVAEFDGFGYASWIGPRVDYQVCGRWQHECHKEKSTG